MKKKVLYFTHQWLWNPRFSFSFQFILLIICTHIHWVLASKRNLYSDSLRWIPTFHLILITYLCCTHHDDDNNHEVCCVYVESRYAELQSTVENEKSNFHFSYVFLLLSISCSCSRYDEYFSLSSRIHLCRESQNKNTFSVTRIPCRVGCSRQFQWDSIMEISLLKLNLSTSTNTTQNRANLSAIQTVNLFHRVRIR